MPRKPTHLIPDIIAALREHGSVGAAATHLGVTRQALHGLVARTPELRRVVARLAAGQRKRCPTCRGRGTVAA